MAVNEIDVKMGGLNWRHRIVDSHRIKFVFLRILRCDRRGVIFMQISDEVVFKLIYLLVAC